jgi:membrane fusion protein (multidrug efflux system)
MVLNAAKLLPAVVVALGLVAAGWWVMQPGGDDGRSVTADADVPRVEVAEVRAGPDDDLRRIETTVQVAADVPLPSPLRGAVQSIEVDDGASLEDEQLLLRFEQSSQRAELMAAEAERSLLEAELERTRARAEENLAAEAEIEDLQLRLEEAHRQLEAAREAVEQNNIRAPFAGTVSLADIAPGEIITRGETIATFSSESERVVRFELPRRLTTDIAVGDDLTVRSGDGTETTARIMALGSAPGEEATTVTLTAVLADPAAFRAGATATVEVPVTGVNTAVVPASAVLEDARGVRVFRIERGLARSTPVEKGRATEDGLRVRGPLNPGDVVAISKLEELADGMRVAVADGDEGGG